MPPNRVQEIAVQVDQAAADLAFQMKMIPAGFPGTRVLIAGAFAFLQDILMHLPFFRQPFKVAVYGRLPYIRSLLFKVPQDLESRYMGVSQGCHVIKDELSLLGIVGARAFVFHNKRIIRIYTDIVNMKMETIFILLKGP
jgi:hypothetical protein